MGLIVEFPEQEQETTIMHFDREKILHGADFLKVCMQEETKEVCKCMCSKECIDETINFLKFVSEVWE